MTLMITASDQSAEHQLRAELAAAREQAEQQRQRADASERRAVTAEQRHRDDITLIGEKLIAEADDRDWCEVYDEFVDYLNINLHVELPLRERDFTVTAMVELRVDVTATSEGQARDLAEDLVRHVEQRLDAMDSITAYPQESHRYDVTRDD
ncbi:hypothetical protein [Paractinoplanes toevensis]|uniref:Uncharacterized protein n=1 Tax=Paractinoplanes toevensis TaxID=571911 RepID=A0A919WD37_9ACTN|nr:hypothetical protein [Actinoplanes toevensis]GIM98047.1 hypothetical protein Ato02nite_098400 [Actinoplanes toevensis]